MHLKIMHENIKIVSELDANHGKDLLELYKHEYWTHDRVESDLDIILSKSSFIIGLVDTTSNKLIGFTRGLTDHFRFAYIYDVIVHSEFRSLGLGHELIKLAIEHPAIKNIRNIELVCKRNIREFYQEFGFAEDYGNDLVAMRRTIK